MTTRTACFVVTGGFITDHSRDRVFEYGWEEALRFLNNSIAGMSMEQRIDVLSGKMQLLGTSSDKKGLRLVPEKPTRRSKLLAKYSRKFAGVWYDRSTKKCWMPYARVNAWNADDMVEGRIPNRWHPKPHAAYMSAACGGDMKSWNDFRCVRYMNDPVEDRVLQVEVPELGRQMVLWRIFEDTIPLWMTKTSIAQTAIKEFVAAKKVLDERGATKGRISDARMAEILENNPLPPGPDRLSNGTKGPPIPEHPGDAGDDDALADELATRAREAYDSRSTLAKLLPLGLPPEVTEGVLRNLSDDGSESLVPESTDDLIGTRWAWVQGDGTVWKCRHYMDHQRMAEALCKHFGFEPENNNPDDFLTTHNWVRLSVGLTGPHAFAGKRITARQRDVVHDWLMAQAADEDHIANWASRGDGSEY